MSSTCQIGDLVLTKRGFLIQGETVLEKTDYYNAADIVGSQVGGPFSLGIHALADSTLFVIGLT